MAPIKYHVKLSDLWRSKAIITPSDPSFPTYTADFSWLLKKKSTPSIVFRQLQNKDSSSTTAILGAVDLDLLSISKPFYVTFQNPFGSHFSSSPSWIPVEVNNKWTTNGVALTLPRTDGQQGEGRKYCWKRTSDVQVQQNALIKKLDYLHLKLVDDQGKTVATFVHDWSPGWNRGTFVFEEEMVGRQGEMEFEKLVIFSGLGVVEYVRKISGLNW